MTLLSVSPLKIQVEVISIVAITAIIFVLLFLVNRAIVKSDPLEKPKGILLLGMIYYQMMDKLTTENMGAKAALKYSPYIASIALYMAISNLASLVGFNQPTSNFSVTLTLALITFYLIQSTKIRTNGIVGYFKGFFEPFAPFVIMNVFGMFAPLLSMSLRLFGNITSGGTLMQLFYIFTAYISNLIPVVGKFNFLGVILAPALHVYFDIFSGLIQTYIFIMLTTIFIGNELPQE
jgi:F-type H+-transporting ATPase subunit a